MLINFLHDEFYPRFKHEGEDGTGNTGGSTGSGNSMGESGLSGKFVEKLDPVSGQKVKIPIELESVLGHFISHTRGETEKKYKPVVEALENEKNDLSSIKNEYEKLKESMMSAEERAQANAKKVIDEHEKKYKNALEDANRWKGLFFETIVRNDILSSFGDVKLCNPQQVAVLFETEGNAKPEEQVDAEGKPLNRFGTKVTLNLENDKGDPEVVEGTPAELFKRWIHLPRNLHHIQSEVQSGGGSKSTSFVNGKQDFSKLPPKERLDAARNIARK